MLRLETSGSNAATAFSEIQAQQKRQRSDQVCLNFGMPHRLLIGAILRSVGVPCQRRTHQKCRSSEGGLEDGVQKLARVDAYVQSVLL